MERQLQRTSRFTTRVGAMLVAIGLVVASCGSDDDGAAPSESSPPAAATTEVVADTTRPAETVAPTSESPSTAPVATDETGPASGDPLVIGFVNMEAGPLAQPAIGDGARAAVSHINDNLGGVNGRPLEFDQCFTDLSPESSAKCGNQFVGNGVEVVFMGLDFTSVALLPILQEAGIAIVGQTPITPADYQSGHWFSGSQVAYALGAAVFIRDELQSTKVAVFSNNTASAKASREAFMIPSLEAAGAEVEVIEIDPAQPDFSVYVATALSYSPDLLYGFLQDTDCTKLVVTARQLGYEGDIIAGSCAQFARDDPAAAEGVYTLGDMYSPDDLDEASETGREEVGVYVDAMAEYAPDRPLGVFTQYPFAGVMNLYRILEQIGVENVTAASVDETLAATLDEPSNMANTYSCAEPPAPEFPAVCGADVIVFQVQDGKLVQVTDWIFGPDIYGE